MSTDKFWFAIYVKSRSEKKVARELQINSIEHFLPTIKVLKQWSDRKKLVEEPLFRSYVFVNVNTEEFYKVVHTPGFVKYVSFEGKAVPIPNVQITAIKQFLEQTEPEKLNDADWTYGKKVEVISGSMTGLMGELVDIKGKQKVKVQIETVGSAILIQIPKSKLRIL